MTTEEIKAIQRKLKDLGFPISADGVVGENTRLAVRWFKQGYAWRYVGVRDNARMTLAFRRALDRSHSNGGRCSDHFFYRDWKSHGNGWIRVNHHLVRGLEEYRAKLGHTPTIVSGYRDPAYNADIGGAISSQHLWGAAADIPGEMTVKGVRALGRFSGIGYEGLTGKVVHVDVRHQSGHNETGGTPDNPTTWRY